MRPLLIPASLLLAGLASSAVAAPAGTAFDLICVGREVGHGGEGAFADRISVDLATMRWCDRQAGCPFIIKIPRRQGDRLTLLAAKTPYNEAEFEVDLKSASFSKATRIPDRPGSEIAAKGVCSVAPFTPLP